MTACEQIRLCAVVVDCFIWFLQGHVVRDKVFSMCEKTCLCHSEQWLRLAQN